MRNVTVAILTTFCAAVGLFAEEAADAGRVPETAVVGKIAPDFSVPGLLLDQENGLAKTDHTKPFQLSAHKGKRPVLIIFSSFT
jgi:hypothetical protein